MLKSTQRGFAHILLVLILLVGLVVIVYLVQTKTNLFPKADEGRGPIRGQSGDLWADVVLGQKDFSQINAGTAANKVWLAHGVIVDHTVTPNRMYIYDSGNNRVLGFSSDNFNQCIHSATNPLNCSADLVIGQPDFTSSGCNLDSAYQGFPLRAKASEKTLCGLNEAQLSISEGGSGSSMAVDKEGNLYVTDFSNHRVLKYNQPFNRTEKTNLAADEVWGQDNFIGNNCNKAQVNTNGSLATASPSDSSLCFTWGNSNNWTAGVDVDSGNNVWVVDSGNNRVLRFPNGSKHADLVLGQPNFSSNGPGSNLNQLKDPSVVRVTVRGVYVADRGNNRVLLYSGALSSGMEGQIFGNDFLSPAGIDIDPNRDNTIWIDNVGKGFVEPWDENTKQKVTSLGQLSNGGYSAGVTGSIGITKPEGNMLYFDRRGHDVFLAIKNSNNTFQTAKPLFGQNPGSDKSVFTPSGLAISDDQLILVDGRVVFWDHPLNSNGQLNLTTNQPANGFVDAISFTEGYFSCCYGLKVDKAKTVGSAAHNHLYTSLSLAGGTLPRVEIFNLPLHTGDRPIKTISVPYTQGYAVLGRPNERIKSQENPYTGFHGFLPTDDGRFLWLSLSDQSRVVRLKDRLGRILADPAVGQADLVVDVILGQTDTTGTTCNRGQTPATPNSMCFPGMMSFDLNGNLWVSDHSLEIRGNSRLLEFEASLFPTNTTQLIIAPNASKVIPSISSWEPAFLGNKMVVGLNPYGASPNSNGGWFPAIYTNPLTATTPTDYIKDYYSMALPATFDNRGNLYMADLDRARVLIYKDPFNQQGATITPPPPVNPPPVITPPVNPPPPSVITSDNQSPQVSITTSAVSGTATNSVLRGSDVTIQANATDNVGVTKTEFYVDNNLTCSDSASPYNCLYNVPNNAITTHTLRAKAYDSAGNSALSNQVSLFVRAGATSTPTVTATAAPSANNDTQAPQVSITYPRPFLGYAVLRKNVNVLIQAAANDNVGVTKLEFYVDNRLLTCPVTSIANSCLWRTPGVSFLIYNLAVKAYDAAGNSSTTSVKAYVY
jgi:hypothetical protein